MKSKNILIVDDQEATLFLLEHSIRLAWPHCRVTIAYNGEAALRYLKMNRVDLILLDYMMPGMNGLEVAQSARKVSPNTKIVLMTAYGGANLQSKAGQLDLDGYLDKPFSIREIGRYIGIEDVSPEHHQELAPI